jgi:hypothetical protein
MTNVKDNIKDIFHFKNKIITIINNSNSKAINSNNNKVINNNNKVINNSKIKILVNLK